MPARCAELKLEDIPALAERGFDGKHVKLFGIFMPRGASEGRLGAYLVSHDGSVRLPAVLPESCGAALKTPGTRYAVQGRLSTLRDGTLLLTVERVDPPKRN